MNPCPRHEPEVVVILQFLKHDATAASEQDSQNFPEGGDLSVHHLSLFHRVAIQLQQVSFSEQRAETHHLLVPVKHELNGLI